MLSSGSGRLAGRAGWNVADQMVASLGNAALSLVVARSVSTSEFGAFAVAFAIYAFVLGIAQAVGGQVLIIRFSDVDVGTRRSAAADATATALTVGVVSAAALAALAAIMHSPIRNVLLAVSVLLPALLVQDTWRTVFISAGEPRKAFLNDLTWTLLQMVLFIALVTAGTTHAFWFILAWGGAAAFAALLGGHQAGQRPHFRGVIRFLSRHGDLSRTLVAQWVVAVGSVQVAFLLIAVLGGVQTVGALRGAQTILGPANVLGVALVSFAVPELVRASPGPSGLMRAAAIMSGVLIAANAAWGAILLFLPDRFGLQLLGASWRSAREVLPAMVLLACCVAATSGCGAVFRALDRPGYSFLTSAASGALMLILSVAGGMLAGAAGAADGFALAASLVVAPAWFLLRRAALAGRRAPKTPEMTRQPS